MQLKLADRKSYHFYLDIANTAVRGVHGLTQSHFVCRNALEDPWEEAREDMYTRSVSPEQAPDKATYLDMEFEGGNPVAIDGKKLSPASLLTQLNKVRLTSLLSESSMVAQLGWVSSANSHCFSHIRESPELPDLCNLSLSTKVTADN